MGSAALGAFLSLQHPLLRKEEVALARLLAVAWLVTGHVTWAPAVHVPWFPLLAALAEGRAWPLALTVLGFSASWVILLSRAVRTGALGLAGAVLLGLASAQAAFAYNRLFVGLLLLMIGLGGRGLPRLQVAVLYLGAGLDKLLTPDWRSGRFLDSFVTDLARFGRLWGPGGVVGTPNLLARVLASRIHQLSPALSWLVIGTELALAVAFALGLRSGAVLNLLLQLTIAALTGSSFGMFFFAATACSVLLVPPDAEWTCRRTLSFRGRRHSGTAALWLAPLVWWPGPALVMACMTSPAFIYLLPLFAVLILGAGLVAKGPMAQAVTRTES